MEQVKSSQEISRATQIARQVGMLLLKPLAFLKDQLWFDATMGQPTPPQFDGIKRARDRQS